MKTDTRIVISLDKQFYSEDDEVKIHVRFNKKLFIPANLTVLNPAMEKFYGTIINTGKDIETFVFLCGGPLMITNGYYIIRVQCGEIISEAMFEYYKKGNQNPLY